MALGIGYGLPFVAQHGTNPYKTQWSAALQGAKGAGASVEDENAGTGSCLVARGQDVYTDGLPSTPSLLIVPQFYKAGNLYQDVPPFVAEDTTMRFAVSRNTTATRVNSSGLIESVASGVPRIDWLGQSCPALLVEPSAQNLAFHSESWVSGNNWTLTDVTNVTGATSAPNGNATANALSPTAASASHFVFSNGTTTVSYTSGTIYTQSAFFKAGTGAAGQFVQLTFPSARFTQLGYANFDLIAGTVSVVSGASADANRAARIESYGDGWYRCIFTATCNSTGTGAGLIISLITSTGSGRLPSFTGVTGNVLYGWGAQLETGSIATTYIPTTTAAVSRAADVISASGALVSGLIGQTEGTMYFQIRDLKGLATGTGNPALAIRNTAFTNWIGLTSNSVLTPFRITVRSTTTTLINYTSAITEGKVAIAYSANGAIVYVNGSEVASTATNPNLTLNIVTMEQYMPFKVESLALYTTRLSNDQLAELTRL